MHNRSNKYFGDNYVAILKRKGESPASLKIEKPAITPVETNADKQSAFVKMIDEMPASSAKPVFLDYKKDIQKTKLGKAEILYVPNKDNDIFRLSYRYKIGSLNDKKQSIASQYIQFLGTDKMTAEEISKAFYKIACSFNVSTGEEYTTVNIEGLQENFENAVKLYEEIITNVKADDKALIALKARLNKARKDAKANKGAILQGLTSYALYGTQNKFNHVLSDNDLNSINAQELVDKIKNINNYEQTIIYYGPSPLSALSEKLKAIHQIPSSFIVATPAKIFKQEVPTKNKVLFADYDMVQAETRWIRNTEIYNPEKTTLVNVFNNYFGGGMGSLVFQTIRESKALAYSTYGYYIQPQKKDQDYYMLGYVGSQADKFNDATKAMNELLTKMPELNKNLELAKNQVKKDIQTERISQDAIIYNYLNAKNLGLTDDVRKQIYKKIDTVSMAEIKNFHQTYFSGKPYIYAIVASEKRISKVEMEKLGEVKKLTLEEIFGY